MPKPDALLYDDVHKWTFNQPKDTLVFPYRRNTPDAERQLRDYRVLLRQAERFYLDDDFVSKSLEVSRDFNKVKTWVNLARLPYGVTWIEFDCRTKVTASRVAGTLAYDASIDDVPKRMGFLLQTIDENTGVWALTIFSSSEGAGEEVESQFPVFPHLLTFFLAPEGPSIIAVQPPKPWKHPFSEGMFGGFADKLGFDPQHLAHHMLGCGNKLEDGTVTAFHPEFENRLTMAHEPLHSIALKDAATRGGRNSEKLGRFMSRMMRDTLDEERGIIRWLIAILGMMNAVPTIKHYFPAQPGHMWMRGRDVPFMAHNVVTLKLPKQNYIAYIHRKLRQESDERRRNRAHRVRGYFRTIEYGNAIRCKHAPTMVENGIGICLKCEQMIRWIPDGVRGDASLGWVNHDYLVEAS